MAEKGKTLGGAGLWGSWLQSFYSPRPSQHTLLLHRDWK